MKSWIASQKRSRKERERARRERIGTDVAPNGADRWRVDVAINIGLLRSRSPAPLNQRSFAAPFFNRLLAERARLGYVQEKHSSADDVQRPNELELIPTGRTSPRFRCSQSG